jgi:hypothetical protein
MYRLSALVAEPQHVRRAIRPLSAALGLTALAGDSPSSAVTSNSPSHGGDRRWSYRPAPATQADLRRAEQIAVDVAALAEPIARRQPPVPNGVTVLRMAKQCGPILFPTLPISRETGGFMKRMFWAATVIALACGGAKDQSTGGAPSGSQPVTTTPQASGAPTTSTTSSGGGSIEGTVKFAGAAPSNPTIDMTEEPTCKAKYSGLPKDPIVSVSDGGLANVFVYVKSGLPAGQKYEAPKEPVMLDQEGCLYKPRALGVMVNQPVDIRNSDAVLHNIKAVPKKNRGFNISQPQKGMETTRTFSEEELPVPIQCNVHGWMHGDIFVVKHPFFAVTDEKGSFKIKGLPAGTYTIEAIHEKLGTKTGTATVSDNGTATVSFSFGG